MRENNGDSVEAGQAMPLGRVPASPAITNADNTKLRATISEDSSSLTAPASFMAGEEQPSGPEINSRDQEQIFQGKDRQTQADTGPTNSNRYRTGTSWPVNSCRISSHEHRSMETLDKIIISKMR